MKVLMLSWEFRPHVVGGLGKAVTELIPALIDHDVQVTLLTPQFKGGEPREEVMPARQGSSGHATIYRIDMPDSSDLSVHQYAQLANRFIEERAESVLDEIGGVDLIHAHDWLAAFAAVRLKHVQRIPLLATIHATEYGRQHGHFSDDLQRAIHGTEWWLAYESWRLICCSYFMADEVATAFRVNFDKIDVVPNGVDSRPFDAYDGVDLSGFRSRYAAPNEKIVLSVGRVVYEKGLHVLIEALPEVLAGYHDTKLVVTGEGPHLAYCKARAQELGVSDRIYFAGFVSNEDRNRLLRIADCAVFPSLYEPFGIVALEAMAARAPVVVSNVGGLTEVVEHNETGLLVHPGSSESLAWGILHTLKHPDWSRARAENGYRVATTEFSWQTIAKQTKQVYEQIVAERRAANW